jgi:DNA mismatch endonuclease (patch repair protein)
MLHRLGYRFRVHGSKLPGRPDILFPRRRQAIFVHGCFWHAHDCRLGKRPTSHAEFWKHKAIANRERDARKEAELRLRGWRVFTLWQCQLNSSNVDDLFDELATAIRLIPTTDSTSIRA